MRRMRTLTSGEGLVHDVIGYRDPRTLCGGTLSNEHDPIDNDSEHIITCLRCVAHRAWYDGWEASVEEGRT